MSDLIFPVFVAAVYAGIGLGIACVANEKAGPCVCIADYAVILTVGIVWPVFIVAAFTVGFFNGGKSK